MHILIHIKKFRSLRNLLALFLVVLVLASCAVAIDPGENAVGCFRTNGSGLGGWISGGVAYNMVELPDRYEPTIEEFIAIIEALCPPSDVEIIDRLRN